ncbi:MAG: thioredoxin-dependent thiol peroxidase [Chitinophagales bacterium]|nr:thioredoxin-dependent thiol peroxidase [Chitinophagales bacterium]
MLNEGDKAPAFNAKDQTGKLVSLKDFLGKKVILYFYPEDDTPTCTIEACNLRDNFSLLKKEGFVIVGVSPQNEKLHRKFQTKFNLPFQLLADTDRKIIDAYECWALKKMFGHEYMGVLRQTFIISEKGKIVKIFRKVHSKNHAQEILDSYLKIINSDNRVRI